MRPAHHLDHSTVLAYAAGTLDEAFNVVIASHLAMCPDCRAAVRAAEAVGGELIGNLPESPVSTSCRDRTLARLDRAALHRFPAEPPVRSDIPAPLARLLPVASLGDLPWRRKAPGVAMFDVKLPPHAKARLKLLRLGPGRAMPDHGHGGGEITLILSGAYCDRIGRFGRGDVADLDAEIEHQPVVERGEDCICLMAFERPARFKSAAARLMQPFVGI